MPRIEAKPASLKQTSLATESGGRALGQTYEPWREFLKIIAKTLLGALALAGVAAGTPASAMPVSPPLTVAADAASPSASVETVRWRRPYVRRGFVARPRYYRGRGYGYRRGLPGRPIRRILRAL